MLLAVVALGCAAPDDDASGAAAGLTLGRQGSALSGGSIDESTTGVLALLTVTRERIELCTATLIAPNLLLTARHCIADTSVDSVDCDDSSAYFAEPYGRESLWVNHAAALSGPLESFGLLPRLGGGDEFVPVAEVHVLDTDEVCGADIAALILDEPFEAEQARPIDPRLDEPVQGGEAYTAYGFGATPAVDERGVRRARGDLAVRCSGADCGRAAPREFEGGDGVCSGDSGGPALDAEGRSIGVASRSIDCSASVYSEVPSHAAFIRQVAQAAVARADYPAPAWLVAPPARPAPPAGDVAAPSDTGLDDGAAAQPPDSVATPAPAPAEPADAGVEPDPSPSAPAGGGSGCSLGAGLPGRGAPAKLLASCLASLALATRRRRARRR